MGHKRRGGRVPAAPGARRRRSVLGGTQGGDGPGAAGVALGGEQQVCAPDYGLQQQLQEQGGLGPPAFTVAELGRRLPTAPAPQALLRHGWKAEAVVAVTDNRFDYLCLLETGTTRCVCFSWVQRRR